LRFDGIEDEFFGVVEWAGKVGACGGGVASTIELTGDFADIDSPSASE
jgi:hypothetical protein